jgi:hypothetical protein
MIWYKFSNGFPSENHFPIWKYDGEFKRLQFLRNINELGIMLRSDCIKENLYWAMAEYEDVKWLPEDESK